VFTSGALSVRGLNILHDLVVGSQPHVLSSLVGLLTLFPSGQGPKRGDLIARQNQADTADTDEHGRSGHQEPLAPGCDRDPIGFAEARGWIAIVGLIVVFIIAGMKRRTRSHKLSRYHALTQP
jgi:hypothetical protein